MQRTRKQKWIEAAIIAALIFGPALFLAVIIWLATIEGPRTFKIVDGPTSTFERVK